MEKEFVLPHDHDQTGSQQQILEAMPTDEMVQSVSDSLKQLGDSSRLRIFWLLCHTEECVTDIAEYVHMTAPAVSHHLRLLKAAGLITSRRNGKEMLYRTADTPLADALHHIVENIAEISCPS